MKLSEVKDKARLEKQYKRYYRKRIKGMKKISVLWQIRADFMKKHKLEP